MTHLGEKTEIPGYRESASFRLQGVDHLQVMAQEEVCPIIKQYFDYLENALMDHGDRVDVYQLQEMLLEISLLLRSGKSGIRQDGYHRLLNRLTAIYTKGLRVDNDRAYAGTAANFADILESVSQEVQDYDFHPSVSLLLHYMDKLFKTREESWLEVYEHLLSMPDSIRFMQRLKVEHLNEINGWIEEGVDNLFTLWDEQLEVLAMQDQSLSDLELQILHRQAQLAPNLSSSGVVDFSLAQQLREIRTLDDQRQQLMSERCAKLGVVELLEANIREFSERLTMMHRSVRLKLVWDNPNALAL